MSQSELKFKMSEKYMQMMYLSKSEIENRMMEILKKYEDKINQIEEEGEKENDKQ